MFFNLKNLCDDKSCHKNVSNYSMFLQVNVRFRFVNRCIFFFIGRRENRKAATATDCGWVKNTSHSRVYDFSGLEWRTDVVSAAEGFPTAMREINNEIYEWAFDLFQPEWTNFVLIQLTNDKALGSLEWNSLILLTHIYTRWQARSSSDSQNKKINSQRDCSMGDTRATHTIHGIIWFYARDIIYRTRKISN